MVNLHRGEIWWADLPTENRAGPGFRRPVLVIQADSFNQSNIQTVIVVAMTTNLNLANAPGNVYVSAKQTTLPKDSVINVSQILTLDRSYFEECMGTLPTRLLRKVDSGIRMVLKL